MLLNLSLILCERLRTSTENLLGAGADATTASIRYGGSSSNIASPTGVISRRTARRSELPRKRRTYPFPFERDQRLRDRTLGRPQETSERAGIARVTVGAADVTQGRPLRRTEPTHEPQAAGNAAHTIDQLTDTVRIGRTHFGLIIVTRQ